MTGVIISPWWFYLINVVNGIKGLSIAAAVISGIIIGGYILCTMMDDQDPLDPADTLSSLKYLSTYLKEKDNSEKYEKNSIDRIATLMECVNEALEKNKKIDGRMKIVASIFIVSLILAIAVPSKQTIIEMLLASNATYENVGAAFEGIKNAADYIIGAIKK